MFLRKKRPKLKIFFGETDFEEINQLISELNEKTAVRKNDIEIKYYKIAKSVMQLSRVSTRWHAFARPTQYTDKCNISNYQQNDQ